MEKRHDWEQLARDCILGSEPDAHLARKLGVGATTVKRQREKRGIPLFRDEKELAYWDQLARDGVLGGKPDKQLARELGVSHDIIRDQREKRGIPAFRPPPAVDWDRVCAEGLFEQMSDRQLANHLSVHRTTVRKHRERLGASRPEQSVVRYVWDAWPQGARDEICSVVERNDAPAPDWRFIPLRKMVERLRVRWGVHTIDRDVERFCKMVLSRQDWRTR